MRYPTPAVSAVIFNSDRRLLLTLRSKKVMEPGTWCLPGGHFEGGRNWLGNLAKEVKEEVGLEVVEAKLIGIYSNPADHVFESHGETKHFLVASFLVTRYEGNVVINDEVDKYDWFSFDQLPTPLLKSETVKISDAFQFKGEIFVR